MSNWEVQHLSFAISLERSDSGQLRRSFRGVGRRGLPCGSGGLLLLSELLGSERRFQLGPLLQLAVQNRPCCGLPSLPRLLSTESLADGSLSP